MEPFAAEPQTLAEAIRAYTERFDEGPPIFGLEPDEAMRCIRLALASGKGIEHGADEEIPPGAVL